MRYLRQIDQRMEFTTEQAQDLHLAIGHRNGREEDRFPKQDAFVP